MDCRLVVLLTMACFLTMSNRVGLDIPLAVFKI